MRDFQARFVYEAVECEGLESYRSSTIAEFPQFRDRYFNGESRFNSPFGSVSPPDCPVVIASGEAERDLIRLFGSAFHSESTAFGQQNRTCQNIPKKGDGAMKVQTLAGLSLALVTSGWALEH